MKEIYFDNNATTRPLPPVRDEIMKVMGEDFGNPSSIHSAGERVRNYLLKARQALAGLLGCSDHNKIIFTSSGTEANNLVFYSRSIGSSKKITRILTTAVEHSSILKMCNFLALNNADIEYIKISKEGLVDIDDLKELLKKRPADLVSVQWVNNETGVVQDLKDITDVCAEWEVPFHTDAAQSVGKLEFKTKNMDLDYLTLAGHKFHAPQGIGAVYVKDKISIHPFLFGGFQEEGFRPGTENIPGIVGMGKASEIRNRNMNETIRYMSRIRDTFEDTVLKSIEGTQINGARNNRICNTTNIMFRGIDGRKLLAYLDTRGIRCSQSSACTNFDTAPSYVLRTMGISEEDAYSSIRFSFSEENTDEEVRSAVEIIVKGCNELRG